MTQGVDTLKIEHAGRCRRCGRIVVKTQFVYGRHIKPPRTGSKFDYFELHPWCGARRKS